MFIDGQRELGLHRYLLKTHHHIVLVWVDSVMIDPWTLLVKDLDQARVGLSNGVNAGIVECRFQTPIEEGVHECPGRKLTVHRMIVGGIDLCLATLTQCSVDAAVKARSVGRGTRCVQVAAGRVVRLALQAESLNLLAIVPQRVDLEVLPEGHIAGGDLQEVEAPR